MQVCLILAFHRMKRISQLFKYCADVAKIKYTQGQFVFTTCNLDTRFQSEMVILFLGRVGRWGGVGNLQDGVGWCDGILMMEIRFTDDSSILKRVFNSTLVVLFKQLAGD